MSDFDEDKTGRRLEQMNPSWREMIERTYAASPARTHSELVHTGYWLIAAQLRIDLGAGRLSA